tara:strand:+ start:567 stop:854 length:288 start_codon:yes stop_codon:yes gene_type:complete
MVLAKETQASRLDRIEQKIDKLSDAMIALARAEEKLVAIDRSNNTNYERMNKFSSKLDKIEDQCIDNAKTIGVITKSFWLVTSACAIAITSHIFM